MHGIIEVILALFFCLTAATAFALWRSRSSKRSLFLAFAAFWPIPAFVALYGKHSLKAVMLPTTLAVTTLATIVGAWAAFLLKSHRSS